MDAINAVDFLSKLLNRQVSRGERLKLSSAKRARFAGWLEQQGFGGADALLEREFTLDSILPLTEGRDVPVATQAVSRAEASDGTRLEVGIDIQAVEELSRGVDPLDLKASADLCAMFTHRELSYAEARPDPLETLTGLYAAKEAIWKSSGAKDAASKSLRAIEVLPDETGKPRVSDFAVSISHSGGFAVAVACRPESRQSRSGMADGIPAPREPSQQKPEVLPAGRYWLYIVLLLGLLVLLQGAVLAELVLFRR
jgi:holo-[acyl-carrier protein] synthase